jgi:hypothetical protein
MTRAFKQLPIGVPVGDIASRMHAYGRISDNTVGRSLFGLGIKAFRVEAQQQHFVEPRAIANRFGFRIHRPREGLRAAERHVIRCQRLGAGSSSHRDQEIAFARSFSGRICLRQRETRRQGQAQPNLEGRSPPDPPRPASEFAAQSLLHPYACKSSTTWPYLAPGTPALAGDHSGSSSERGREMSLTAGGCGAGQRSGENEAGTTSMFCCSIIMLGPPPEGGGQIPLALASSRMRKRSAASL